MPLDPPKNFLLFFINNSRLCRLELCDVSRDWACFNRINFLFTFLPRLDVDGMYRDMESVDKG